MNALQPLDSQEYPPVTPSLMSKRRRRRSSHRGVAAEITLKLLINVVLCTAAVTAFLKLMPYHISQQGKLQEVRQEVKETQTRVNHLRENFSHNFDPYQAKRVMQDQSPRVEPHKHRIVLMETPTTDN